MIRQIDAEGGIVDFRYDAQGNRVALRDPVGNITTWLYDGLNRVVEERDPFYWEDIRESDALFANLTDDDFLDLIAPTVPFSNENPGDPLYDDPSGAHCDTNTPADHVRLTCYDEVGNQSKTIDRNGRRREFDYDHAGRMLEETWFTADTGSLIETITFSYDVLGNMLTAADSNSNYLFTYDPLNRLESVDNNPDGTRDVPRVILTYGYDAQGNVTMTQDDSGVTVESEYDQRNRLAIRNWYDADGSGDVDDARVDFQYNAAGREAAVQRYSDLTATTHVGSTARTYDAAGRSDLLRHDDAVGSLLASYDYDYDFSGLLIHEERDHQDAQYAQSIDYQYDLTGQLTDALFSGQDDEHYEYDANGNRLISHVRDDRRTYSTRRANRLSSDGQYRYEYDHVGNITARTELATGNIRRFSYDHRNRLLQIVDSTSPGTESPTARYDFDVFGRRISRTNASNQITRSVFHGDSVWLLADGHDTTRHLFGRGVDDQLSIYTTETHWQLNDRLLVGRSTANDTGRVIDTTELNAIGAPIGEVQNQVRLQAGRPYDEETQLYDFRSRSYDPSTGRFLSPDSVGFRGGDANLYRFALGAPNNFRDPFGTTIILNYSIRVSSLVSTPTSVSYVSVGVSGQHRIEAPSRQTILGSIIGGVHGFGATNLFFASEIIAGNSFESAYRNTREHVDNLVCTLKRTSTVASFAGEALGVSDGGFIGSFVGGFGVDTLSPFPKSIREYISAVVDLACADGPIGFKIGGFENGASAALGRLEQLFGLS